MPIIAAIPNYNMAVGLDRLLPKLVNQGYDAIYVLDDASTDNSKDVVAKYKSVKWVSHKVNTGAGGARNMILEHVKDPTIIHFLDADILPLRDDFPAQIRKLHFGPNTGFIGGIIYEKNGYQHIWNYGPKPSIVASITSSPYFWLKYFRRYKITHHLMGYFSNRPYAKHPILTLRPYWATEANLLIRSDTLKKYGAFDEAIREDDIQPIASLLYKDNMKNGFTDLIPVTHLEDIDVRRYNRYIKFIRSEYYIIRKYVGLMNWLFPFKDWPNRKQR